MNCLWILALLCCCGGNNTRESQGCGMCHREREGRRCEERSRFDCDRPVSPFAPERSCRERDVERARDCECRATEMSTEQE